MLSASQRGRLVSAHQNCALNAVVDVLLGCTAVLLALISDSAEKEDGALLRELCKIHQILAQGLTASTAELQRLLVRANCGETQSGHKNRLLEPGKRHEACNFLGDLVASILCQSPHSAFAAVFAGAWSLTLCLAEIGEAQAALGSQATVGSILSLLDSMGSVQTAGAMLILNIGYAALEGAVGAKILQSLRPTAGFPASEGCYALASFVVYYGEHLYSFALLIVARLTSCIQHLWAWRSYTSS